MLSITLFVALFLFAWSAQASKDLPEHARGGTYFKELQKREQGLQGRRPAKSSPLVWQAPVDHFDKTNTNTFNQRYYVNDAYWKKGSGPVFYEIGGEGTLSGPPGGFIEQLAQNHSALLIALEHRFYGESIPNGNANTENYRFLSVEQALADLASFTDYYKQTVPESKNVPWVVFGGSYPGALSSWYRAAYPDYSIGSLSSSGVVNCIIDYYQFDMSVSAAAGNQCADNIRRIQRAFEKKIGTGPEGFSYAKSLFHCEADIAETDFYYMIADAWSMMIQYSAKTGLCSRIDLPKDASDEQVMENFASYTNEFWGADFCAGGFYNTQALKDPARWDVNARSWRYQTCSQVSYFNTAPPSGSLRSQTVNLDYHLKQCAEIFGEKIFPSSVEMNTRFGGAFPHATNVFYSDFSDDPWQRASVTYPVSEVQPYFLAQCDNCGHCLDFHATSPSDPAPLQQSRREFERYLNLWLEAAQKH